MPKIPEYSPGVVPSRASAPPPSPFRPSGPGTAAPEVTDTIGGLLDQQIKIEDDALQRANQSWLRKKRLEAMEERDSILNDKDEGMMAGKHLGEGSMAFSDVYDKKWSAFKSRIEGEALSDWQKENLKAIMDEQEFRGRRAISDHQNREIRKADSATNVALMSRLARDTMDNPMEAAKNIEEVRGIASVEADNKGLPSDVKKEFVFGAESKIHAVAINSFAQNHDYEGASEYFEKNKKKMTVKDRGDAEGLVKKTNLLGQSQDRTDKIMEAGMSYGDSVKKAREIDNPELRKLVVANIGRRFDEIKKGNQVRRDDVWSDVMEYGRNNPGTDLETSSPLLWSKLDPDQRAAWSRLNSAKPIKTDVRALLEWDDLKKHQIRDMSVADFNAKYYSRVEEKHRKPMLERLRASKKDDAEFDFSKQSDGMIVDAMITMGEISNKSDLKDDDEKGTLYFRAQNYYNIEKTRWQEATGKNNIPEKESRIIIDGFFDANVKKKNAFGQVVGRVHVLSPEFAKEGFKIDQSDITLEMRALFNEFAIIYNTPQGEDEPGARIDPDKDDDLAQSFYKAYLELQLKGGNPRSLLNIRPEDLEGGR